MAVMKKIKIKRAKNLIPFEQALSIKNEIFDQIFPYGFLENLTYPHGIECMGGTLPNVVPEYTDLEKDQLLQYGFFHTLFADDEILSPAYEIVNPIFDALKDKFSIKVKELLRVRIRMTTKVASDSIRNYPHVDLDSPHKVFLYYVNDSDGDTFFYKKKKDVYEEIHKETPTMGTGVLFDGSTYHASSTPTKVSRRVTINFNFR